MNKEFLESYTKGAFWNQLPPETILVIVATLLLVVVLLVVGFFINRTIRSRAPGLPSHWIIDSAIIQNIFQAALDARSKLEMRFDHSGEAGNRFVSLALTSFTHQHLHVELTAYVKVTQDWIGRHIECYFQTPPEGAEGAPGYYSFVTEIVAAKKATEDYYILTLAMPEKLDSKQKRANVRVEPPRNLIRGIVLWRLRSDRTGNVPADIRNWGRPLVIVKRNGSPEARLADISGTGAKIELTPNAFLDGPEVLELGDKLLFRVDLFNPSIDATDRYYLQCRVVNIFEDFASKKSDIGIQFVSSGVPRKDEERIIEQWRPVMQGQTVEPISNWVFRRHLELYRDRGLT